MLRFPNIELPSQRRAARLIPEISKRAAYLLESHAKPVDELKAGHHERRPDSGQVVREGAPLVGFKMPHSEKKWRE
jgi:hypothetical protein